jgi:hypothetical protein
VPLHLCLPPLHTFPVTAAWRRRSAIRSARKQGKVEYEGEMLFQGVHEEVVITVKEQK